MRECEGRGRRVGSGRREFERRERGLIVVDVGGENVREM